MIGHPLPRLAAPVMDAARKLLARLRVAERVARESYETAASRDLPIDLPVSRWQSAAWAQLDAAQRDRQAVETLIDWASASTAQVEAPQAPSADDDLRLLATLDEDAQAGLAQLETELAERHRWTADQTRMPMLDSYSPGAITAAAQRAQRDLERVEQVQRALNQLKRLACAGLRESP